MTAALIDTSVVVGWDDPDVRADLPDEIAICTITLAELATGPHLAADPLERARRQTRLQQVEELFDPLAFDRVAARSYGQVVAAVASSGRTHRRRMGDLLIAAIAHSNGLQVYTRNPNDFAGLEDLIAVVHL